MAISTALAGIRTQTAPPGGFDPGAASALELRRYGLPQRPDPGVRPDLAARWDAVFSRPLRYITPEFTPVPALVPGIERRPRLRPDRPILFLSATATNDVVVVRLRRWDASGIAACLDSAQHQTGAMQPGDGGHQPRQEPADDHALPQRRLVDGQSRDPECQRRRAGE